MTSLTAGYDVTTDTDNTARRRTLIGANIIVWGYSEARYRSGWRIMGETIEDLIGDIGADAIGEAIGDVLERQQEIQ